MVLQQSEQLTLFMATASDETFESFYVSRSNQIPVAALRSRLTSKKLGLLYLWGSTGSGKTHLLRAACDDAQSREEHAFYLPLSVHSQWSTELLEGIEALPLICLDELESIAGCMEWERAIFDLYNRIDERGKGILLVAGRQPPQQLGLSLPDLVSRLRGGEVHRLRALDDTAKVVALQLRAKLRGFTLSKAVANFLLTRLNRQTWSLFRVLDRIDGESIRAHRKVTIPFVKAILDL